MGESASDVLCHVLQCSDRACVKLSARQRIYYAFSGAALKFTLEKVDRVWKQCLQAREALDRPIDAGKSFNDLHNLVSDLCVYLMGLEKALGEFQNASLLQKLQWSIGISNHILVELASSRTRLNNYSSALSEQLHSIFGIVGSQIVHPVLRQAWALASDHDASEGFPEKLARLLQMEILHQTYNGHRKFWRKCIKEFTRNFANDEIMMIHWMNQTFCAVGRHEVFSVRKLLSLTLPVKLQAKFRIEAIMVIDYPVRCFGNSHEVCLLALPERSNLFLGIDISGELLVNTEELNYFYINVIQGDSTVRQLIPFPFREKGYGWNKGRDGDNSTTFGLTAGAAALLHGNPGGTVSISISCQTSTDNIEVRRLKVEAAYLEI